MNIWSKQINNYRLTFSAQKYVLVDKVLTKAACAKYAQRIKKVAVILDSQCPLSPAVYGAYDDLLIKLKPFMEGIAGESLYPTYSYARLYTPGERLKPHTDRPSCEISCTLTLSCRGDKIWPIFFKRRDNTNSKIEIPIGSLVAYKGMELEHWRNKFTQNLEQTQVFLHYVRAQGQYADYIFDRRGRLNV